ncbi:MAG: ATP synthase F1 subunit epsilon [Thermoleophilia bacterium]|nr:ATP synthase F1 subunit epsilon [Thermoleophilia bacterium]
MSNYTPFPTKVVTPQGVLFEGDVRELELTSAGGHMGILARRSPVVADLKLGHVRVELEDGTWKTWATEEGFAQASNSTATVVVEEAVALEDLDEAWAAQLVSEGKAKLEAAGDDESAAKLARRDIAWGEHLQGFRAKFSE